MAQQSKGDGWMKVAGYAVWGALNAVLFVLELARDDPRWWKLVLTVGFALTGIAGVLDGLREVRSRRPTG